MLTHFVASVESPFLLLQKPDDADRVVPERRPLKAGGSGELPGVAAGQGDAQHPLGEVPRHRQEAREGALWQGESS